ncbi:MAG: hypothetical protein ACP5KE_05710 [Candidatus Methanodesulfokora sp.]
MPVRVKVELKSTKSGRLVESIALLNTGFTSDELDVHIPKDLAEKLDLWPPPAGSSLEVLETAGGEVMGCWIKEALRLRVVESDRSSKDLLCNALVSPLEREVLLSDAVIEELEIEILSPRTGLWRFKGEEKTRRSAII